MSCILLTAQALILSRVGTGSARDGANVESGADSLSEGPPRGPRPRPPEPDSSDRQSHNLNVPDAPPNYDRATTDAAAALPKPQPERRDRLEEKLIIESFLRRRVCKPKFLEIS